jgi:hypothetical protein
MPVRELMIMEPIKLIKLTTEEVEDELYFSDLITKFEPVYEYDENDNETQVGIKILESCQYDQDSADKDWKEVLKWIQEDEYRMETYGSSWYMFGIRAVATLHFPMRTTESSIIQKIKSPGIYGMESDSDDGFFRMEEEAEIAILLDMLESMHVETPDDFICTLKISDNVTTVGAIKKRFH